MRQLIFIVITGWLFVATDNAAAQQIEVTPLSIWQDSHIDLAAGTTYQLNAEGVWSFGGICGVADPTGAGNSMLCEIGVGFIGTYSDASLVGRIGEQGTPFYIGKGRELIPDQSGRLYVGPNVYDRLPDDNTGKLVLSISSPSTPPASAPPPVVQYEEGPRVALIIGNSAYKSAPLANPVNDAKLITTTLQKIGFKTILELDADQKTMKRAINRFGDELEKMGKDAVGLFYYAGHGVQVAGRNYLLPVGADIQNEKDVDVEAVAADGILGAMDYAGNRLNVIVLDACRNNPFKRSFRSALRGLARMDAPRGSLIAYSTSPDNVAADGDGDNSPYTEALSSAMLQEGVAIERMFRQVRNHVMQTTNDMQIPWEASSLTGGDFFFNARTGR